jgi:hypothetical protein
VLTPKFCKFEELGILEERVAPQEGYDMKQLQQLMSSYDRWNLEAARSKLGLSAIAMSLDGFGSMWLLHLLLSGMGNATIGTALMLLLAPISKDVLCNPHASEDHTAVNFGVARADVPGHVSGFVAGVFLYLLRVRCPHLGKLVIPPFATIRRTA